MRKLVTLFALGLVLLLTGCGTSGGGGSGGTTVSMGGTSFVAGINLSITAGQAVTFDDPTSSGGTHLLVTGTNGTFSAEVGAPSEFASADGISFHPGDSKAITFATAGTYHITCRIHPSMQATIVVS
jgi:plastocyanin